MEKKKRKEPGIKEWAMILAAGALLLFLSIPELAGKKEQKVTAPVTAGTEPVIQEDYTGQMEKRLEEFLMKFDGVTSVKVILTVKSTTERVVLSDTSRKEDSLTETDASGGTRKTESSSEEKKTVITGEKEPYLVCEKTPQPEGIAIIVSGPGKEKLLDISEAVQALFNLPAHKVKVIWN